MKPITKNIIFLVVAFIIVIIITASVKKDVAAPVISTSPSPTLSATVVAPPGYKMYTNTDVTKHKTATDCWTIVGGKVYNLTPFINQHPGGVGNITKICGVDGTATFTAQHGTTVKAQQVLATLVIGELKGQE